MDARNGGRWYRHHASVDLEVALMPATLLHCGNHFDGVSDTLGGPVDILVRGGRDHGHGAARGSPG